jgi:hypothetical protein
VIVGITAFAVLKLLPSDRRNPAITGEAEPVTITPDYAES